MSEGVNLFDLAARITVDNSGVDKALTDTQRKVIALAKEFQNTEAAAKKSAANMGSSHISGLSSDYDKLAKSLGSNSVSARLALSDFVNLSKNTSMAAKASHEAESSFSKLSEGLRILGTSSVVAEGPLNGLSSRLRALGTETTELGALGP